MINYEMQGSCAKKDIFSAFDLGRMHNENNGGLNHPVRPTVSTVHL